MFDRQKCLLEQIYNSNKLGKIFRLESYAELNGISDSEFECLTDDSKFLRDNGFIFLKLQLGNSGEAKITEKGIRFVENNFEDNNDSKPIHNSVFNINNSTLNNAIIGDQKNAALNIQVHYDNASKAITESSLEDQEVLRRILDDVTELQENQSVSKDSSFLVKIKAVLNNPTFAASFAAILNKIIP